MGILLDATLALHALALMLWFGVLGLDRAMGVAVQAVEWRLLRGVALLALASALVWPAVEAAVVLDDPHAALDPAAVVRLLVETRFGRVWLAREGVVLLAVLCAFSGRLCRSRAQFFLLAAALGSLALVGHAAAVEGVQGGVERLTLALHLLAAGAWLGALPSLAWRARRWHAPDLVQLMQRFSRLGLVLVVLVLASGAASAWFRAHGDLQALARSAYGQWLFVKITGVGLMGLAALNNRNRLTPALAHEDDYVRRHARQELVGSIGIETLLGAAVVVVAVILGAAEAPGN